MELTAPFVLKNAEKRIVYGPVLVPGEPDHDGDVVKAEKIEAVAHDFVEKYGNIDLQHTLNNVGRMIESYIAPVDLQFGDMTVPKGSWMMGVRVTDDTAWDNVKKGKLTGFSIMGIPATVMKSKSDQDIQAALKRTTLADIEAAGGEWVVNAVSLVDEPCVPKAKFVIIKSKQEDKGDTKDITGGFFAAMKQIFASNKSNTPKPDEGGKSMNEEQIKELIQSTVKSAVEGVITELVQKNTPDPEPVAQPEPQSNPTPEPQPAPTPEPTTQDDMVSVSKADYEALTQKVEELQTFVEKAKESGLFFGSKKLKGQDGDSNNQNSAQKQKPTRDAFGRRI